MTKATPASDSPTPATRSGSGRAFVWLFLLTGILLFLSWLGWKAWRSYQTATSLLSREQQARQLLEAGPEALDPNAAEALVTGLRQDVVDLQQELGFILPVLPLLRDLPGVGPLAANAEPLLAMADAGTEAAVYGFRGLKPALTLWQESGPETAVPLPELLGVIDAAKPDLARAGIAIEQVTAARGDLVNEDQLPGQVQQILGLADEWLPAAQDGLRAALVLPQMAGLDGPRRYLVLAQNQDELRPSGGFISGAGVVQLDEGRVTSLEFQDANNIDAWVQDGSTAGGLAKPYADAPPPLRDFMLLDLFLFRDANFWPDFRASGQKAIDFYAYGRDIPPLDGAIAIDQEFLRLLLQGIGPVNVGPDGQVINSGNVVASLQDAWTLQDGAADRKAFLGPFAAAIMQTLFTGLGDADPLTLARSLTEALDRKHLQIYMRDPQAAAVLGANGWDGRMQPPLDHDALMVVDTNVGYNKANTFVERDMRYDVRLEREGGGTAGLLVTHRHTGADNGEPCWQGTTDEYLAGSGYAALADKCYWNYLRVYAPEGSALSSGPQHLIPGQTWFGGYDWNPETAVLAEIPGFTTFASWFLLPRSAEVESAFQYRLPSTITRDAAQGREYGLQLYKQAGVEPHRVQVSITLPEGTAFVAADPPLTAREGNRLIFDINLDRDQRIRINYE